MKERVKSIDVLRGVAVAIMVLCNNPGNPERNYVQLRHLPWNGLTFADFGFPFFILIMGMTIPIVMERRMAYEKNLGIIIYKIVFRSIILVFLGLVLNGFPAFDFNFIRIPGVLQRIGVVYLVTSLIYLAVKGNIDKDEAISSILTITSIIIIVGYYFIFKKYGFETEGSLVQIVDSKFLSGHLAFKTWDPEGIASTIPSLATGILGCTMGYFLVYKNKGEFFKVGVISIFGVVLLIGSFMFNKIFPFNKMVWSSSFVLVTAGAASLSLALLYLICDMLKKDKLLISFTALGASPIFVYLVSELIRKTLWRVPIYDAHFQYPLPLINWITLRFVTPWAGEWLDSFYFSFFYVIFWMCIMGRLYSKNKFIRI